MLPMVSMMAKRAGDSRLNLGVAAVIALSPACDDETIQRLRPGIDVCVAEEAKAEECNRPIELGELPITLPHEFPLFVINRGSGSLDVSAIEASDAQASAEPRQFTVAAGGTQMIAVVLTPRDLGVGSTALQFDSDDPERMGLQIPLRFTGTPKPVPRIELCLDEAPSEPCAVNLPVDFGIVRRSQEESRSVSVKNVGMAPLNILRVRSEGSSSVVGELLVVTSTRAGELAPGSSAPAVIVYEPLDSGMDSLQIIFESDDPANPEAKVLLSGQSTENLPPIADARQSSTGSTSVEITVDDLVVIDGSRSADPEGDALRYSWSSFPPARSTATLDDPRAGGVRIVPDVAGTYRVELQVFDSLGQGSTVVAVVLIQARPRYAMRAIAEWGSGGDVDLHLVARTGALFSSDDCHFGNPNPDFGIPMNAGDDPNLVDDAVAPPGRESIVAGTLAPGTYGLYAHHFDDLGTGPANVSVSVVFDDASIPAFFDTRSLPRTCSSWHVGDIVFPGATFTPSALAVTEQCP